MMEEEAMRKIRRAKFRPIPEEDYADSPKAKTFVNEVPKESGLGRIYSYRYKDQKAEKAIDDWWPDPKKHLPEDHHLRTGEPAPKFDHTFEDPNAVPQSEIDELMSTAPDFKSGYRRITPKQWKPSQKSTSGGYTGFTKVKVPESTGFTKIKVPKFTGLNGLKLPSKPQVKKKVKGDVDLFGPTKTQFIPPKYLDRETKGFDPLRGIPKGITRNELGLVPKYLKRPEDKPKLKKSYGAPKPGTKFIYPEKGGPYSNQQQEQLRKSDTQVGGAGLRLKSMATIGALGAGAMGLGKFLPKRPKYTTRGTPNPKDPMNRILHTPPIPKQLRSYNNILRNPKTNVPRLNPKTPKSVRAEDYVTRRTAKELYKRIFPRRKYDGKIVKTPKKVLRKFQNRKK
jgi:hypothetical protein